MQNLISFELRADFGFFRKPDANDGINLSYTMLHKPALLGILGAIIGLEGYKEKGKEPEYLTQLKNLKVGVKPLNDEKGNFSKIVVKYSNTIGYANKGTNYLTEEATLIKPAYKCFLLLDMENEYHKKIKTYLQEGKAEYLPYFGKNEFSAWWDRDSFQEYEFELVENITEGIVIENVFLKTEGKLKNKKTSRPKGRQSVVKSTVNSFVFFERLPVGFNEELFQYEIGNFTYTNFNMPSTEGVSNVYWVKTNNTYVQLN